MKYCYRFVIVLGLCYCLSSFAQQEKTLLFSCFDSGKNSKEWFSYFEKELVANGIMDDKKEIYWDLHLITLFNLYTSEFDSSQVEIINKIYHDNQITTEFLVENDHCLREKSKKVRELNSFKELAKTDVIFFKRIDSLRINGEIDFKTKEGEYQFYKTIAKEVYSDTYFENENFKVFLLMQLYYYFNKEDLNRLKNHRKKVSQSEDIEENIPVLDKKNNH